MDIKNDSLQNVINIYDNKINNNPECQKIVEECKKYRDCLNKNNICLKERQECIKSFNNYYLCYINSNKSAVKK